MKICISIVILSCIFLRLRGETPSLEFTTVLKENGTKYVLVWKITDDSITEITKMANVSEVRLGNISPGAMRAGLTAKLLEGNSSIEILSVPGAALNSEDKKYLIEHKIFREINLEKTKIDNSFIRDFIKSNKSLETLCLYNCDVITSDSVGEIISAKKLKHISVTSISSDILVAIRKDRPDIDINIHP